MIRNLVELYQYRGLLWSLTERELKARYRASAMGFLWTFLNPTLLMLVYSIVFRFLQRGGTEPHYTYLLFVGLLPWLFFSSSLSGGASAISDRRDLVTKVHFPAQVLPASVIATNLCNYLLSLPLMFILGAFYGVYPGVHALLFPLVLLVQLVFTLSLAYLLSALNVAYRDLQHIVGNLLTLWFFLTPVVYPFSKIPERFQPWFLYGNPMAAIVTSYQAIFYEHRVPDVIPLVCVLSGSIVLLWLASMVFSSRREQFAELV